MHTNLRLDSYLYLYCTDNNDLPSQFSLLSGTENPTM